MVLIFLYKYEPQTGGELDWLGCHIIVIEYLETRKEAIYLNTPISIVHVYKTNCTVFFATINKIFMRKNLLPKMSQED